MKISPVILCGGSGVRLWPLSRHHLPKQFLKLIGDLTLFQQSIKRVIALEKNDIQIEEILIVTNENHRFLVLEQLNELNLNLSTKNIDNLTNQKIEFNFSQDINSLISLKKICNINKI